MESEDRITIGKFCVADDNGRYINSKKTTGLKERACPIGKKSKTEGEEWIQSTGIKIDPV